MTGKKTRPVIGKLLTTTHRSGVTVAGTSPKTPLDLKILSPRGIVNCDMGGVGLGIVAALGKSADDIQTMKITSIQSDQIRIIEAPNVDEESFEEEYTIVTRHMPNNSYTKVYNSGLVYEGYLRKKEMKEDQGRCLFDISPTRLDIKVYPGPDFLSFCHLCKKKLHGKDIYMYRGEKAFCSMECRCREMGMEERREKHCGSEAVSRSPGQMLSTGIFVI